MKKLLVAFLALFACFGLVSCGEEETPVNPTPQTRTFKADGQYQAFAWQDNDGAPQVTWVTVTIANDKITDYDIDCLQGKITDGVPTWNEKTKKELGWAYHMHFYDVEFNAYEFGAPKSDAEYKAYVESKGKLEWFQQAELIEAYMLANGPEAVELGEKAGGEAGNLYFENITNVSIADNDYVALAKKAVQNAKDGKVVTFATEIYDGAPQIDFAEAMIDSERKIQSVKIDCIQSEMKEDKVVWAEQTKQQKGWAYHMHGQWSLGAAEYQAWCEENSKLEWFQQVELICKEWLASGTLTLNEENKFTNVSGVSIQNNEYKAVLEALVNKMGCKR